MSLKSITKIFLTLIFIFANNGLQSIIQTESSAYFARKKILLQEGLEHFTKQSKEDNLSLLKQLLSEKKNTTDQPILQEIEEGLVIAQIISEESSLLREKLEKEPKNFIVSLLLCILNKENPAKETPVVRRKKKTSFFSPMTLGLAITAICALCYAYVAFLCDRETTTTLAPTNPAGTPTQTKDHFAKIRNLPIGP